MDLAFTPEQEGLVPALRAFAKRELQPRSSHWDKTGEFPFRAGRPERSRSERKRALPLLELRPRGRPARAGILGRLEQHGVLPDGRLRGLQPTAHPRGLRARLGWPTGFL